MSSQSSIFVGIVGILQGFFLKLAILFCISLVRRIAGTQGDSNLSFLNALCMIVGNFLAALLVLLVPAVLITIVFRIQNYNPFFLVFGLLLGLAGNRIWEEIERRKN